ncbi:MAG: VCBS repeat-containing protein, partial [Bacteroidales bacterium]|nr:VCBS repeat-containing protein [Bacteroidales bacterium]
MKKNYLTLNFRAMVLLFLMVVNGVSLSGQTYEEIVGNGWGIGGLTSGTATMTDLNNDGLIDLISKGGDGLLHFIQDSPNSESFTLFDSSFIVNTGISFNGVQTFSDIDGDGLLDLLVGRNTGDIVHYEQSSPGSFDFVWINDTFSGINESSVAPAITDLDGDGLLDMAVGSHQDRLHYEQASLNSYVFNLVPGTFSGLNIPYYSKPTFTDIDNDNLIDLLVGGNGGSGILRHFEQTSLNSLTFNYYPATFSGIVFENYTAPSVADFDSDGLLDIIAGSKYSIQLHLEQNSVGAAAFTVVNRSFIGIDVGRNAKPSVMDVDNDGLLDMLIGGGNGRFCHFEQINFESHIFEY